MPNLLTATITTAVTAQVGPSVQLPGGAPAGLVVQANFFRGSGGTTVDGWVQCTLDGGTTWTDLANFHFTTSSLRALYFLSNLVTPSAVPVTATDGTLAANTAIAGMIGPQLRVKYTTTGTYGGGSTLAIDVAPVRG